MYIIEALKTENLRISNGDKWLCYDEFKETWTVHQRKKNASRTVELINTADEEKAVAELLK